LTFHAIFNHRAYIDWVDQIIFCKSSSFSIRDATSQNMFLTPQALRLNTYNNGAKINLTKVSFSNCGHGFATITNLSNSHWALA
jgi:hypothetical protein